jgi:DNA-binding transcriptional ArsR family regulator
MDEIVSFKGEDESHDRQFVNALARGLEILRCFRPGEIYLTNTELAKRTGLPKPTISRLTHTLTRLGYLEYSEDQGRYQLGSGVLALGYSLLSAWMCASWRVRPCRNWPTIPNAMSRWASVIASAWSTSKPRAASRP